MTSHRSPIPIESRITKMTRLSKNQLPPYRIWKQSLKSIKNKLPESSPENVSELDDKTQTTEVQNLEPSARNN